MLKERNFEVGNLIRLASSGMEIAEFVDVRDVIINRYKEVYGSDIDLSTASADGVFVNDIALIINNILQVMKSLYSNLDVDTASGTYLDTLCKLANVTRMPATKSTASLIVTSLYTTGDAVTFGDIDENGNIINNITFVDKGGNEWVSNSNITLLSNESAEIKVTCTEIGPIDAPAGWINQTLIVMNLSVEQKNDAIRGNNEESDMELRKRRSQSSGANGIAVLESLVGALLEITGVDDVKIYNNNSLTNQTAIDGTVISPHNIYVILRLQKGLTIQDSSLGELIYNKLTPGIKTTVFTPETSEPTGVAKTYKYLPQMLGVTIQAFEQNVYWKQAIGTHPNVVLQLTATEYFVDDEIPILVQAMMDYANNLKIGEKIKQEGIYTSVYEADPMFKGQRTFNLNVSGVVIMTNVNNDTYYDYTTYTYEKKDDRVYITIT